MSNNSSNQKIKIINQQQYPQQQIPYQFNNDYMSPYKQNTENSHTKIAVKQPFDLNINEQNKQRSSSQISNPLHTSKIDLFTKYYERSSKIGQPYSQILNQQNSDFATQINEKPQQNTNCQSYSVQNVQNVNNIKYTNSQCQQNQAYVGNYVNKGNNIINNNQQVYQQPITQQRLSNQYNNNNNFEAYQPQSVFNTQLYNQNNNVYQVQNYPTENHTIKQLENQSIANVRMEKEETKQYGSDNNCEIQEDLTSSLVKSIVYQCQHCNTRVSRDIIQLDCYHFYHIQCFQDHLLHQISAKTYRPIQCHCRIKITQSQVKNVLKQNQISGLVEKLLESEINSIFKMYQKIQNLNKCGQCNFFWVGSEKDKTQSPYYCQNCERKYY